MLVRTDTTLLYSIALKARHVAENKVEDHMCDAANQRCSMGEHKRMYRRDLQAQGAELRGPSSAFSLQTTKIDCQKVEG